MLIFKSIFITYFFYLYINKPMTSRSYLIKSSST